VRFADALEAAAVETVESGVMTGDLLAVAEKNQADRKVNTEDFIDAIAENLRRKLS